MARINIEECWWSDIRRSKLIKLIGCEDLADAAAIRMWRLAQEHWGRERQCVPIHVFEVLEAGPKLIQAGLAEVRGDVVYVRGSSQYHEWLLEKRDAAKKGGKKSAQRPRNAKGQLQKTSKQTPSKGPSEPKQTQASYSYSSSGSCSDSNSDKLAISEKSPVNPVSFYCDLWQEKNGKNPDIRPKEAGQITGLAKDVGLTRACEIMRAYFSMPDPFFIKRGYDVSTMLSNLAAIQQFEANGKIVTRKVQEQFETEIDKIQGTTRNQKSLDAVIDEREREKKLLLVRGEK